MAVVHRPAPNPFFFAFGLGRAHLTSPNKLPFSAGGPFVHSSADWSVQNKIDGPEFSALERQAIKAYIDSEDLGKGNELSDLLKAIADSKFSIVVFSENYASSTWCLKELVQILKCKAEQKQIVMPVFYQVDPSHVRKQEASFAQAFAKHERDRNVNLQEVQSWKSALIEATNISGWDSRNYGGPYLMHLLPCPVGMSLGWHRRTGSYGRWRPCDTLVVSTKLEWLRCSRSDMGSKLLCVGGRWVGGLIGVIGHCWIGLCRRCSYGLGLLLFFSKLEVRG
ncbi:hypothetical protein M0R45_036767 [Rubus argutus]|uniref:TIR domain-containing protein n=1 Tax=Rubus argutus TaxID=59490 RepID=A0AAW1VYU5_RUBAR